MTRDALILACADLIAEEGLGALSLRKVAERVGIKAPSIYVHFENKEALLDATRRHAAGVLAGFLLQQARGRDARARLMATAMGYLRFAEAHPALFSLFFLATSSGRRTLDEPPGPDSPYRHLIERVQAFLGAGRADAEILAFGIWCLVHGAAVLRLTHLRGFAGPLVPGTRENLERLLDGWQAPIPSQRA